MTQNNKIRVNIIVLVLGTIITSFYLFPIGFAGLPPSLNTKQVLAIIGVLFFVAQSIRKRSTGIHKETFVSFLIACVFSICCFLSTTLNNTDDYTYVTYVVSFSVWLAGAYGMSQLLMTICGEFNLSVLTKFMAITCIVQCVLALIIENNTDFASWANNWIIQDRTPIKVGRLYGFGMSLDSGGVRICMTLLLIAYHITNKESRLSFWTYIVAFCLISVLGNMIARTTTVGVMLGLIYIFIPKGLMISTKVSREKYIRFNLIILLLFFLVLLLVDLYNTNPDIYKKIRFAFEAFFNFFETGEFRTDSSDVLMDRMWIWPHDTFGWILGYGYFEDLYLEYAQTDIGYCRFIMYCGLLGLSVFSLFFIYNASVVARKLPNAKLFSLFLVVFTFILWIKVSTDIFQLYALLFCVAYIPSSWKNQDTIVAS